MAEPMKMNLYDRCHQLANAGQWQTISKKTAGDCAIKWPDTFSVENVGRRSFKLYYVEYTWGYRFDRFFASN